MSPVAQVGGQRDQRRHSLGNDSFRDEPAREEGWRFNGASICLLTLLADGPSRVGSLHGRKRGELEELPRSRRGTSQSQGRA